ncbi:MAG: restriction endonuclease subunit S [Bacteroidales bacterium]|jgi:type I restriction enzyme S subunit|nr:restriction endonuclease subunit S [Bacteroidales bacterium]
MSRFSKYVPSGVDWIGDIPSFWKLLRIKSLIKDEQNGVWGEEEKGDGNDVICIRVADFDSDFDKVTPMNNTLRSIPEKDLTKRSLMVGDLLIEKSGGGDTSPVGRVGFYDIMGIEAVSSNFIARLRLIETVVDSRFLFYFFKKLYRDKVNTRSIKQTTGIQNIDTYAYFNERIALPPKQEQVAIANYLDEKTAQIDKLISDKQRLIELLREEQAAVINEAVSGHGKNWEKKKLKYLAIKIGSGITPKGGSEVYLHEGVPLLRSQNIYSDGLRLDELAFISEDVDELMSNSRILEGDVLLNITGASIGRCYYVHDGFGKGNVNQHVCIVRPNQAMSTKFLHFFLVSFVGQTYIKTCQNGANREGLNFQQLGSFVIPVPQINEQQSIIEYLERESGRIIRSVRLIEQEIDLLNEFRAALISEVVTGKIKVA